jgi:2-polyprenyl-6-methoxyphenol hydroxylase-like FAD-dependent oxidoreductase
LRRGANCPMGTTANVLRSRWPAQGHAFSESCRNKSVLINGIGIARPTLAYWLSRHGFSPTLVEVAQALRTGGYVIDFRGHGYEIAARMGLEDAILREGYHVRELRLVNDAGERVASLGTKVFGELTGGHDAPNVNRSR